MSKQKSLSELEAERAACERQLIQIQHKAQQYENLGILAEILGRNGNHLFQGSLPLQHILEGAAQDRHLDGRCGDNPLFFPNGGDGGTGGEIYAVQRGFCGKRIHNRSQAFGKIVHFLPLFQNNFAGIRIQMAFPAQRQRHGGGAVPAGKRALVLEAVNALQCHATADEVYSQQQRDFCGGLVSSRTSR